MLQNAEDGRNHSILDFLERPYPLSNFEWTVAAAQFSTLYSAEFPDAVLTKQLYQQKMYGFLGLRADLCLRLQVNAQPFQAGRLIMAWVPYYKYLGTRVDQNFDFDTAQSMVSLTGCPHVEIDLSQTTTATLCVPYSSPMSYFNLANGNGYWGKLYIKIYSPLSDVSGTGQVDNTLWFNFENPKLAFPTGVPIVTASANPIAQVGSEEYVAEKDRSFSAAANKLAGALRTIPHVMELQNITQPAAWASDRLAEILKFFGLSKIESLNVPEYIKQSPAKFLPNADGTNLSHSLSLLTGNAIELMPDMVPEAKDEMALAHIVSTPTFYTHFVWNTNQTIGTNLFEVGIHPLIYQVADNDSKTVTPSFLTFASCAFVYWRGSITFTLKFIKTKFHSGRCRIFFQPGATAFDAENADYNYSQVIDIRSETDVKFSVPYVSVKPWSRMSDQGTLNVTGTFYVQVLNDLRAVSTVSQSIDVLVEVSAGSDFELAAPTSPMIQPVIITSSTSSSRTRNFLNRLKAQVGEEDTREDEQSNVVNADQMGEKLDMGNWNLNLAMIGEKCLSLRQLYKRSSQSASVTLTESGSISIFPFAPRLFDVRTTTGTTTATPSSFMDYFNNLFAFWRGSVNIKVFSEALTSNRVKVEAALSFPTSNGQGQQTLPSQSTLVSTTIPAVNNRSSDPVQIVFQELEGCVDITCPYYSDVHMSPVSDYTFNDGNVLLSMYPPYLVIISNLPAGTYNIFRSACDSYQLGYLIGPPRCEFV